MAIDRYTKMDDGYKRMDDGYKRNRREKPYNYKKYFSLSIMENEKAGRRGTETNVQIERGMTENSFY